MRTDLEPEAEDPLAGEQDTTARPTEEVGRSQKGEEKEKCFVCFIFAFNESWGVK